MSRIRDGPNDSSCARAHRLSRLTLTRNIARSAASLSTERAVGTGVRHAHMPGRRSASVRAHRTTLDDEPLRAPERHGRVLGPRVGARCGGRTVVASTGRTVPGAPWSDASTLDEGRRPVPTTTSTTGPNDGPDDALQLAPADTDRHLGAGRWLQLFANVRSGVGDVAQMCACTNVLPLATATAVGAVGLREGSTGTRCSWRPEDPIRWSRRAPRRVSRGAEGGA
jgi:hypothetical protein